MLNKWLIKVLEKLLADTWFITITTRREPDPWEENGEVKVQTLIDYGHEETVRGRVNSYFPEAYSMDRLGRLVRLALENKMHRITVPTLTLVVAVLLIVIWRILGG